VSAPPCLSAQQPSPPHVSLRSIANSLIGVLQRAKQLFHLPAERRLTVIVALNFNDNRAAEDYAQAVSDPKSSLYHRFLTPEQISQRFGPGSADYQSVINHLKAGGLTITHTPANHLSVIASGTVSQVQKTFGTQMNVYQATARESGLMRRFFANSRPIQLPARVAQVVRAVIGLDNYSHVYRKMRRDLRRDIVPPFDPQPVRAAYDIQPIYDGAPPMRGEGRTIAIVSLEYTFPNDTLQFIQQEHLPTPNGGPGRNVSLIAVNGGAVNPPVPSGEANLDVQMVAGMAPLSTILIYNTDISDNSQFLTNYLAVVTQITSDNRADIVTDSWGITPDPNSNGYSAFHAQHTLMTMQGITYLNASGDFGSNLSQNGLYPETDPDVLAVGGTVMGLDDNSHIASESGWSGSGGGYDARVPFTRPSYQTGRGVPAQPNNRLVPDIALHAAGVGSGAYNFVFQGNARSENGTSFASPIAAGCLALVEQYLIAHNALPPDGSGHQRLGRVNDTIYAQNGRNDVWHDITTGNNGYSCTPYWDFVTGWGSVDFFNFAVSLTAPLAVKVAPTDATVSAGASVQLSATVAGSNVNTVTWSVVSGPGAVSASGLFTTPASTASSQKSVIRATSTIDSGAPVSGDATVTINP
jgi:subtilase family serine protease